MNSAGISLGSGGGKEPAPLLEERVPRRIIIRDDLEICTKDEEIIIIDSACDQSVININSFVINTHTGIYFNVADTIKCSNSSKLELVNDCYTYVKLPKISFTGDDMKIKYNLANDSTKTDVNFCKNGVIFKFNQMLLNTEPRLKEALLQPYQARANGVIIDDVLMR